ncbi:sensor histidine kinase [Flavobacterium tistrianum]|uniref:sensor histidine kinase n=1 Tax=Flavobacterium tistrianum TaxID=1685414 RepID=UPI000DACC42E|nr:sensor histidine kinase [Flavobacterium tistrianum]KAF2340412.1 histidine kinase [Flavobacterium tistrianum]
MSPFEKLISYTSAHRIKTHLVFWLCLYIMLLGKNNFDYISLNLRKEMLGIVFDLFFAILLAYLISYRTLPRLIIGRKHIMVWLEFIACSYLLMALNRVMVVYVLEFLVRTTPFTQESLFEIFTDVSKLFRSYFIQSFFTSLFFVFAKQVKSHYLAQKKTLLLEKEKAETELKILKAQLNPHFLFNTLNNIYSLSLVNSPITSQSIAILSEILDCILYRCSSTYVPISQEVTLLNNYISLEKLRYDEGLSVIFNTDIDRNGMIAPLILLSLVENAFKHGPGEDTGNSPIILIDLEVADNQFAFTVKNSIEKSEIESESSKIGLNNIVQQLNKIYPKSHTFKTIKSKRYFTAHLTINLQNGNN